jgi:hypothetical protein
MGIAPWTLVEGNCNRFARLKVLRTVAEALEGALGAEPMKKEREETQTADRIRIRIRIPIPIRFRFLILGRTPEHPAPAVNGSG